MPGHSHQSTAPKGIRHEALVATSTRRCQYLESAGKTLLFMSPIQRGNVQTKLFQLCSTLKAQLLHDGGLHRFRMPRPDHDHLLDLKLFWTFCIYIADMNDTSKTFKNIPKIPSISIHMKVYQAWSRNLVSSCKVCRLEAVAPGNNLKQQESCTSTLAPMVRIDVRSATKAQKVCNQSLQYPPVLFKSFLHG